MNHATSCSFYRAEIPARNCLISMKWEQPARLAAPWDALPLPPLMKYLHLKWYVKNVKHI